MNRIVKQCWNRAARSGLIVLKSLGVKYVIRELACGYKARLRTNDRLGQRLFAEDSFEPNVRSAISSSVALGMTVLDIGANLGYYSLMMSRLVGPAGSVVAFEPQPRMVSELEANVKLNALQNVTIRPIGLSNEVGERLFYLPFPGDEAMGSLEDNGRTKVLSTASVQCSTLDTILRELRIDRVDFVKMDVEGAELQVLEGGVGLFAGEHRPIVVFEAYEANCAPFGYCVFDLLRRFDQLGYSVKQLDECDWCATPRVASGPTVAASSTANVASARL